MQRGDVSGLSFVRQSVAERDFNEQAHSLRLERLAIDAFVATIGQTAPASSEDARPGPESHAHEWRWLPNGKAWRFPAAQGGKHDIEVLDVGTPVRHQLKTAIRGKAGPDAIASGSAFTAKTPRAERSGPTLTEKKTRTTSHLLRLPCRHMQARARSMCGASRRVRWRAGGSWQSAPKNRLTAWASSFSTAPPTLWTSGPMPSTPLSPRTGSRHEDWRQRPEAAEACGRGGRRDVSSPTNAANQCLSSRRQRPSPSETLRTRRNLWKGNQNEAQADRSALLERRGLDAKCAHP